MPLRSLFPDVFVKDVSLPELILEQLLQHGTSTAMIDSDNGKSYTFENVCVKSYQIAQYLHENGIQKGEIATIILPNCPEFLFTVLGILMRGGVVAAVNVLYTEEEIHRHLLDSNSKFVFTRDVYLDKINNAVRKTEKQIQKIFIFTAHNKEEHFPENVIPIDVSSNYLPDSKLPNVKFWTKTDLAFLPFSSGTTGRPKGVMLSHYNIVSELQILGSKSFWMCPGKDEHFIAVLPFCSLWGFIVLLRGLFDGATAIVMSKYDREKFFQLIQHYKVPILYTVPPMLVTLAKDSLVDKYDISSVYTCIVGSAPFGKELSLELVKKHPNIKYLLQEYGMTEMVGSSHMMPVTPVTDVKHGSIGMVFPNYECKVVDINTGKELGPNQTGEICVRSVTCMLGYYKNPKATSETYDAEGWLHTGDLGYYDEEEFFFIIERLKELIKVKGYQVPPAELEDLLLSHIEIKDAAVIGIPDDSAGELPRAYVVIERGSTITERDIRNYVDSKVAPYKMLKGGVEFVNEIPKSPSGKILRRELRDAYLKNSKEAKAKL